MGARKLSGNPIQLLSLDAISVDRELQSRVATSIEYQREFSEAMLRGDEFPPVTVFWDGKKYRLADGFHRHGAARKAGKKAIRAEIREGGRREALIFSAGANQKFSIPRTKDDIAKAIEMVLSDKEGFTWSLGRISKHVGVSPTTVRRRRAIFCSEKGLTEPSEVVREDGVLCSVETPPATPKKRVRGDGSVEYYGCVGGKDVYLSANLRKAEEKLKQLQEGRRQASKLVPPTAINCDDHLVYWFARKGFGFTGGHDIGCPSVSGYTGLGWIFVYVENLTATDFLAAVGRVLLARQKYDPSAKPVVLCQHEGFYSGPPDLAREIGIEVLTPEEFLVTLQREKSAKESS